MPRAQVVTQGWLGELKAHSEYRKQLSPQTQKRREGVDVIRSPEARMRGHEDRPISPPCHCLVIF